MLGSFFPKWGEKVAGSSATFCQTPCQPLDLPSAFFPFCGGAATPEACPSEPERNTLTRLQASLSLRAGAGRFHGKAVCRR